eukprot:TRINITY_DN59_c6_g1_i1.p1 TRINITY_DN59_c6_g1~~TRINITY_DN59_c6_g1_i1.p1  ORF type:complete len:185 (-),score=42.12 TRINITY_DN59_c6_g1_i1:226-753(-)
MISDLIVIMCASLLSSAIAEGISWLLIYRTDSYKNLKSLIDKNTQKLEKLKERSTQSKSTSKKIEQLDEITKGLNRDMSMTKFKSLFAVSITMISFFGLLSSWFDGLVVARLPFEPISFIRNLSHRNLVGNDFYDCSMLFFYILCGIGLKSNLQKLFGNQPPKGSGSFFTPPDSK